MTRKTSTRRPARRTATPAVTPRRVLLAGLGAIALGRERARETIDDLAANAGTFPQRGAEFAEAAGRTVAGIAARAKSRLKPLKEQAAAFAHKAEAHFLVAVAPVLEKAGMIDAPVRRRAPAAKRTPRSHTKTAGRRTRG
jgi:hypothetical protein